MGKLLEVIAKELNPIHDFDNIEFINSRNQKNFTGRIKAQWKNFYQTIGVLKPIARGAMVFGSFTALTNYMVEADAFEGFYAGLYFGTYLDSLQFSFRYMTRYFKKQLEPENYEGNQQP